MSGNISKYDVGGVVFFIWRNSPPVGQGLLHEVSKSHLTTNLSR